MHRKDIYIYTSWKLHRKDIYTSWKMHRKDIYTSWKRHRKDIYTSWKRHRKDIYIYTSWKMPRKEIYIYIYVKEKIYIRHGKDNINLQNTTQNINNLKVFKY